MDEVEAKSKDSCAAVYRTYEGFLKQLEKSKTKVERQGLLAIFITFEQGNALCFLKGKGPALIVKRQQLTSAASKQPTPRKTPEIRPTPRVRPTPVRKAPAPPVPRTSSPSKTKKEPLFPIIKPSKPARKPIVSRKKEQSRTANPTRKAPVVVRKAVPSQRRKPAPDRSSITPPHLDTKPVRRSEGTSDFWWSFELGAGAFGYQLLSAPISGKEVVRNNSFGGVLLGIRWGYRWSRLVLTGDLTYAVGGGSLLQIGLTLGYILNRYFVLEGGLGLGLSAVFDDELTQSQVTAPLDLGVLIRFPVKAINLGLRIGGSLAFDGTNGALAYTFRTALVVGSLF